MRFTKNELIFDFRFLIFDRGGSGAALLPRRRLLVKMGSVFER